MQLGGSGRNQRQTPLQANTLIHREMDFAAKAPALFSAGPVCLGVGAGLPCAGRMRLDLDPSAIDQRGAPEQMMPFSSEKTLYE